METTDEKVKKLAEIIGQVLVTLNDLEDKVYKLEEVALDGKKVEVTQ